MMRTGPNDTRHAVWCYDFSSVSFTHVFFTSDSCFTLSSFHCFDRFRSMFYIHAFYYYMPITCISTHVFHTCYIHVYFLLIYYMPCKHGLFVYKLVSRLSCFLSQSLIDNLTASLLDQLKFSKTIPDYLSGTLEGSLQNDLERSSELLNLLTVVNLFG